MSLKSLYDKVRPQIPIYKDVQPLLEMDRDEKKFDVFLSFHRTSLLISDMKIFLPFTINLDPYIKKKIKEEQQTIDEESNLYKWNHPVNVGQSDSVNWSVGRNRNSKITRSNVGSVTPMPMLLPSIQSQQTPAMWSRPGYEWMQQFSSQWPTSQLPTSVQLHHGEPLHKPLSAVSILPVSCEKLVFFFFFY